MLHPRGDEALANPAALSTVRQKFPVLLLCDAYEPMMSLKLAAPERLRAAQFSLVRARELQSYIRQSETAPAQAACAHRETVNPDPMLAEIRGLRVETLSHRPLSSRGDNARLLLRLHRRARLKASTSTGQRISDDSKRL